MIGRCRGCEEEFEQAYEFQKCGLYLAINPFEKGHLRIIMVDDKGNIIVS